MLFAKTLLVAGALAAAALSSPPAATARTHDVNRALPTTAGYPVITWAFAGVIP